MGAWNFNILEEDTDTAGLSSIAFWIECLFSFQFYFVNFVWETGKREAESNIKWGVEEDEGETERSRYILLG